MEQKIAVVTGGAQGIGKKTTEDLIGAGYFVVAADCDAEAGSELRQDARFNSHCVFIEADISREADVEKIFAKVRELGDSLSLLVNNAGIGRGGKPDELPLDAWHRVIGVNLTGTFLCSRAAIPALRKAKGCIVNISSTRALMSEANTEAYSASKGGIVALTHSLAVSLGPDIRVNCISPGWIETCEYKKSSKRRSPNHSTQDKAQHPAGRVGTPADISSMVLYLASSAAGFITGQNFVIDGGMTRKMIYVE